MMTQPRKAQLLTIGLLALAPGIAVGRKQVFRSSGESPPAAAQDAIYAMLDASRAGDVQAYLANYSGQCGPPWNSPCARLAQSASAVT